MSRQIIDRLMMSQVFKSSAAVHTYVSMEKNREVFTIDFITECLEMGKDVLVPRMKSGGELTHHKLTSVDSLTKNKWGVYEPNDNNNVQLPDGTLIVIPMVAGDFKHNRLGYGKGYYDRFLGDTDAIKVGLCFNYNLCWTPLPVDTFDIKMDKIITSQFEF